MTSWHVPLACLLQDSPQKTLGLVPGVHERKDDRHDATPDAAATTAQGLIPAAFLKEKRVLDDVAAAAAVAAV